MVCHGDRGQGLTDEWRGVLDPADQNCWQSNCHSPHHPPGGFVFPRYVPAVTGPGVLDHFGNAQNLFDFLKKAMPYQAPGSLSDKIYWQLTAYLLRSGGYNPDNVVLSEDNAATIRLDQSQPPLNTNPNLSQPSVWYYVTAGILIAGWVILMIIKIRR
jgi:hypothetical protein